MIPLRKDLQQLKDLGQVIRRFADETQRLVHANPPPDRSPTEHSEIPRMTAEFEKATEIVRKAVAAGFMTSAQYSRIARHFRAIAVAIDRGAAKEAATEKRDAAARRRQSS